MTSKNRILSGRRAVSAFLSFLLSACASDSLLSSVAGALYQEQFGSGTDAIATASLNPAYRYLLVTVSGGQPALLVLGYVDTDAQGAIEVWYSAQGEVIKTQNGRVVGTAGLAHDWRQVRFAGAVPMLVNARVPASDYARVRDDMPGYRYGITDYLLLETVAGVPPIALPTTLPTGLARQYTWLRESVFQGPSQNLPAAWYALGRYRGQMAVVYSYQCLAPQLCLSLQRWPIEKEPS